MRPVQIPNNAHKEDFDARLGDLWFRKGSRPIYKEDAIVPNLVIGNNSGIHIMRYKNTRTVSIAGHQEDIDMMMGEIRSIAPTFANNNAAEKGAKRPHDGEVTTASAKEKIV